MPVELLAVTPLFVAVPYFDPAASPPPLAPLRGFEPESIAYYKAPPLFFIVPVLGSVRLKWAYTWAAAVATYKALLDEKT